MLLNQLFIIGPKVEKLSPAATFLGSALPFQLFRCLMMPSAINGKNCAVSPNVSMKVISSVMWVNWSHQVCLTSRPMLNPCIYFKPVWSISKLWCCSMSWSWISQTASAIYLSAITVFKQSGGWWQLLYLRAQKKELHLNYLNVIRLSGTRPHFLPCIYYNILLRIFPGRLPPEEPEPFLLWLIHGADLKYADIANAALPFGVNHILFDLRQSINSLSQEQSE